MEGENPHLVHTIETSGDQSASISANPPTPLHPVNISLVDQLTPLVDLRPGLVDRDQGPGLLARDARKYTLSGATKKRDFPVKKRVFCKKTQCGAFKKRDFPVKKRIFRT
jgi:hypothetical protein